MNRAVHLLDVNPALDRSALAAQFARSGRLQIRDVLTRESANALHHVLAHETPWGLVWQDGERKPTQYRAEDLVSLGSAERQRIGQTLVKAMQSGEYAFSYNFYPLLDAYLQKWRAGGPHDLLLEHINSQPFLDLIRQVTNIPEIVKADAQATLYAPGQFLAMHNDSDVAEGRRIAYVLNMTNMDWREDHGGYLMFYDDDGDVVQGFRPRFNALNIFTVPQRHNVTYIPPFAPLGRYAVTGWFRDR